jgi:putative transposase
MSTRIIAFIDYPFPRQNDRRYTWWPHLSGQEKKISTVFAGQAVGIKEVHDDIGLVSFMDYDLGYFDLETRVLEPFDNPFGPKVLPMLPVRSVTHVSGPDLSGSGRGERI